MFRQKEAGDSGLKTSPAPDAGRRPFARMALDRKALLFAELAIAALSTYRAYDYFTTGFFVSDEFGYYYDAVHGMIYGGRWFFGGFNITLFRILGITTPDGFAILLPFYLFFWTGMTLYFFYKMLKLLGHSERGIALSLLSSFVVVSFVLLSVGFLTEPVGLSLAMGGIYCLIRLYRSNTDNGKLLFPIAAAFFFGAAGGTREPYNALLVAGGVVVVVAAVVRPVEARLSRYGRKILALLSIVLFVLPAGYLYYANSYATSQAPAVGEQIVQSIVANPPIVTEMTLTQTLTTNLTQTLTTQVASTTSRVITTSTTTTFQTISGTATMTVTRAIPQTTTLVETTTETSVSTTAYATTTTTQVTTEPSYPFYARSLLSNTIAIFFGGLALGWGPLAAIVGLAGFILVLRSALGRKDSLHAMVLLLALASLGSYFVVSYIFAPDPGYLAFQNYSTIIRFSDTALPAFFLLAPFAISRLTNKRKAYAFAAAVIVFLLVAVPTYEVYASSNLNYAAGNPFSLGYRTPAIQVRDYITSHSGEDFYVVGVPYGWYFTPGVEVLRRVNVYPLNSPSLTAPINYTQFLSYRWETFYLYASPSLTEVQSYAPYIYALVNPSYKIPGLPFHLVGSQTVINDTGFVLVKIELSWT